LTLSGFTDDRPILRHERPSEEDIDRLRQFLLRLPRSALHVSLTAFQFIDPRRELRKGLSSGVQISS
jgi:hypothetical protein